MRIMVNRVSNLRLFPWNFQIAPLQMAKKNAAMRLIPGISTETGVLLSQLQGLSHTLFMAVEYLQIVENVVLFWQKNDEKLWDRSWCLIWFSRGNDSAWLID